MPPYLAGRTDETREFARLLTQDTILENMVLTGLRGVGKTVLLETLKPIAIKEGWIWCGTDLSESTSVTEESIAIRILTDLSVVTSAIIVGTRELRKAGFGETRIEKQSLNFNALSGIFTATPGLVADKLKRVLEVAYLSLSSHNQRGLIFAYDEAQNLSDHAQKDQFPLSLLLDVFQSLQRKGVVFMLVLSGLPTLFPKLVEARTFAERMFRVVFLDKLNERDSRDAILRPIEDARCPMRLGEKSVRTIIKMSGGYPYFIQFVCREVYDLFIQRLNEGRPAAVPVDEITRKLDTDFFAGRWARATDRQRELLSVIATLPNCDTEFTVQEVVDLSKAILRKGFSNSHANQMLASLSEAGLVCKNRHGKYSFAVPLLGRYILRQVGAIGPTS